MTDTNEIMEKITKKIDNRVYCIQKGKFCIESTIPSVLYKYYSLNELSVAALENHYIYAANPMEENDLYDATPLLIDIQSDGAKQYLEERGITLVETNKGSNAINPNYQKLGNAVYDNWRIVSFAEDCENELMWAHYAHQTGFCVEFDSKKILDLQNVDGIFPIQYRELEPLSIECTESELLPYIMCLQKSKVWGYEKEWRCLVRNPTREESLKLKYNDNPIRAIYLGYNFFEMSKRTDPPYDIYQFCNKKGRVLKNASRLLKYIKANNIPVYINYALQLGTFDYKKSLINKIDKQNKEIKIEKID